MRKGICVIVAILLFFGTAVAEDTEYQVTDVTFYGEDVRDDNRVFYEIFVGSFSDSDGDGTGDIRGIINRLDYLNDGDPTSGKSLGVEGIWLTPVFISPTYHKYDVTDYYTVDPAFGTNEDLEELIRLCHERDVKVILDLPINHTGMENRWFRNFVNAHRTQNPGNIWYDFYVWRSSEDPLPAGRHFARKYGLDLLYEANFSDNMPELNFDNPLVREKVVDIARFWLEKGVDGFRFDAAKYLYYGENDRNAEFWTWYMEELKQIRPDIWTVAEVWDGESVIDRYVPAVDCFNFSASGAEGILAETAKGGNANRLTAYIQTRQEHLTSLSPDARECLFLSNHDMDRCAGYLTVASGFMNMAANLYILSPGSPVIYYGEEIGLRGSRGGANTDANRRLAMLWGDGDTVEDPIGANYKTSNQTPYSVADLQDKDWGILTYYKRLLMIRRANPEIARGTYTALPFSDTKVGGFLSEYNGSTVAVIHNPTRSAKTVDLGAVTEMRFDTLAAYIGAGDAMLDGTVLTLGAQTSAVLRQITKREN